MYIKYAKKWLNFPVYHMAAGDDVCAWVQKTNTTAFVKFMKENVAHSDKKLNIKHGLG